MTAITAFLQRSVHVHVFTGIILVRMAADANSLPRRLQKRRVVRGVGIVTHGAASCGHRPMNDLFAHHGRVMAFETQGVHAIRLDERPVVPAVGIVAALAFPLAHGLVDVRSLFLIVMTLKTSLIVIGKFELVVAGFNVTGSAVILNRSVKQFHLLEIRMAIGSDAFLGKEI